MSETVWMWRRAWALLDRAERLQRQLFEPDAPGPRRARTPVWEPPTDVYETAEGLYVVVALPGVDPMRVEVTIEGRLLRITGHCGRPSFEGAVVHRVEIPRGCFERQVVLPAEGYAMRMSAMEHGCLTLIVRPADGVEQP